MNQDFNTATLGIRDFSLTYDTESISIVAVFSDEMSAYRGRRGWNEILRTHFLLENMHDFELHIERSPDQDLEMFQLRCEFLSACGRYAFWRLINHQAPEAEGKLIRSGYPDSEITENSPSVGILTSDPTGPWVMRRNSESKGLLTSIIDSILGRRSEV